VHGWLATLDGQRYYPPIGKAQSLPWAEIRLFEVVGTRSRYYHRYRLYAPQTIAEWSDLPASPWEWDGPRMTREELQEHRQALLNLIAANTHLLPRTFDKSLVQGDRPT
jgi:hypothetical protein